VRGPSPAQPRYTVAQSRTIATALDLFGEHGVSGTSLQMIADALGVTKAAVYHQFKTKDAIVLAVTELGLRELETALDVAEAQGSTVRAREVLLIQVIDVAIARRRVASTLQSDPVVVRLLAQHQPFQRLMERLFSVLLGDEPGNRARVQAAMLSAAIGGGVTHPFVTDIDDDTLRAELLHVVRRLLLLPD
jgi:AcrR family transcriptional regulator